MDALGLGELDQDAVQCVDAQAAGAAPKRVIIVPGRLVNVVI